MIVQDGVARVPTVTLAAEISFPGIISTPVTVERIEKFAGTSVGSAVCQFRCEPARQALIRYGRTAAIKIGGEYVFRGTIGSAPVRVGLDEDMVEAVLYDDKWGMQARTLGQYGIGSLSAPARGFPDVGFELVFNRENRPNKDPDALNFRTGTGATYWTLAEILQFVFAYYIDASVATLDTDVLEDDFGLVPSHLALVNQDALSAVDQLVKLAGLSWGLAAGASASSFVVVRPGGGTTRSMRFFDVGGGRVVTDAGEWHCSGATITGSILSARDTHYARSGRTVVETTLRTYGTSPMLARAAVCDRKYSARFASDVANYAAHGLGGNLSAGSQPKPWLAELVTRIGPSGYVAAASAQASQALPRAEPAVWVALDGNTGHFKLLVGGYQIDHEHAAIDFEPEVVVMVGGEEKRAPVNWATAKVAATVAVVLESPQWAAATGGGYLPSPFAVVIDKADLVPELRFASTLPAFGGSHDAVVGFAEAEAETYIAVAARLAEAAQASLAASPAVETPISAQFPFMPLCEIGDALRVRGRSLGATGNEVIVAIRYSVHGQFSTQVDATNLTAAVDPERFIRDVR